MPRSTTVRRNSIATIFFGREYVKYIVKSESPQYVFDGDKKGLAAQLHEVLSVPYQAAVLRDGYILKIQAPNPLPPGRKLGDPRYFGVLTATGDAAGVHDGG